jgi:hypothetical protein
VEPAKYHLTAAQLARPDYLQTLSAHSLHQGCRRDVHQMPRKVRAEPRAAEEPGLKAGRIRDRDDEQSPVAQKADSEFQGPPCLREVLERMPEHNRCPRLDLIPIVGVAERADLFEGEIKDIGPPRFTFEAERGPSAQMEGVEEDTVARSYVQYPAARR